MTTIPFDQFEAAKANALKVGIPFGTWPLSNFYTEAQMRALGLDLAEILKRWEQAEEETQARKAARLRSRELTYMVKNYLLGVTAENVFMDWFLRGEPVPKTPEDLVRWAVQNAMELTPEGRELGRAMGLPWLGFPTPTAPAPVNARQADTTGTTKRTPAPEPSTLAALTVDTVTGKTEPPDTRGLFESGKYGLCRGDCPNKANADSCDTPRPDRYGFFDACPLAHKQHAEQMEEIRRIKEKELRVMILGNTPPENRPLLVEQWRLQELHSEREAELKRKKQAESLAAENARLEAKLLGEPGTQEPEPVAVKQADTSGKTKRTLAEELGVTAAMPIEKKKPGRPQKDEGWEVAAFAAELGFLQDRVDITKEAIFNALPAGTVGCVDDVKRMRDRHQKKAKKEAKGFAGAHLKKTGLGVGQQKGDIQTRAYALAKEHHWRAYLEGGHKGDWHYLENILRRELARQSM